MEIGGCCEKKSRMVDDLYCTIMQRTLEEAKSICEKLQGVNAEEAGIEILHQFMMDLLGRHSLAAHVFQSKSEEE